LFAKKWNSSFARAWKLTNLSGGFKMTFKKLVLILSIVVVCGLLAGGLVYAQETAGVQTLVAPEAQQPTTPQVEQREFSIMLQGGSFLGVYAEDITKENMSRYGLRDVRGVGVTEIVKDSPAEKAGLKKDDVIVRFDAEAVTSARKLNRLVSEVAPDHTVRLTISRGGAEQEISVTLAKRNETQNVFGNMGNQVFRSMPPEFFPNNPNGRLQIDPGQMKINPGEGPFVFSFGGGRRIGISTQTLTKQLADYFGVKDGGLLVTAVTENSPAAKAGLKAGDVITAVDGEKVESSGDIARLINKKQDGDVSLTIVRDRNTRTIRVTPEKSPESSPLMRPGRITVNQGAIRAQIRDAIKQGIANTQIVMPQIDLPVIPEIDVQLPRIQTPRVVLPSIPPININVPQVKVIRNPI
jgi:membrane-associated protease RseP (regulator of RpoE activity)